MTTENARAVQQLQTTRPQTAETFVEYVVAPDELPALMADPRFHELLDKNYASVPSESIVMHFYSDALCPRRLQGQFLSESDRAAVRRAASNKPVRPVPLFVLDTCWPSLADARSSVSFMNGLVNDIRAWMGLKPTAVPAPTSLSKPKFAHCEAVASSLGELATTDTSASVPVVYIPLSKEQGAEPLIQSILSTAELLERVGSTKPSVPPTEEIQKEALDAAAKRLAGVPTEISGRVTRNEKAIVERLMQLASFSAGLKQSSYVVSASWTLHRSVLHFAAPLEANGLLVAAVGNFGQNIFTDRVDLARQSFGNPSVVSVLNLTSDGERQCGSGTVGDTNLGQIAAVGFNGDIAAGSATSYSTPRVAWLLALAESARSTPTPDGMWAGTFRDRLIRARPAAAGLAQLFQTPAGLINLWSQN